MTRAKDKSHLPWSIKGISPQAREAAKAAAAAEGITMGEWLSRAIRRAGGSVDERDASVASADSLQVDRESLEIEIANRIRATEDRLVGVIEPLYDVIEELRRRLDRLERDSAAAEAADGDAGEDQTLA